MTKTLIAAGGTGGRWNNYLGVPKHRVKIDGEELCQRSLRLFPNAVLLDQPFRRSGCDVDKFFDATYWDPTGRTIIVFGDVFFTEAAAAQISSFPSPDVTFYGRFTASNLTGKPYGEIWGVSFGAQQMGAFQAGIDKVVAAFRTGASRRAQGWEVYRAMRNQNLSAHKDFGGMVVIDDWTEDFDTPQDFEKYMVLSANARFFHR